MNIDHTTYDEEWQSRAIWKYLKAIKPAVMLVGGWYDTEDPQGLLRQFDFMEKNTPPADMLVMGPWNHGGFARGDGDRLGNVNFGSKTAALLPRTHRVSVFPVLPQGPRRRQVSQGVGISNRHEPVAPVRRSGRRARRSPPACSWPRTASWPGAGRRKLDSKSTCPIQTSRCHTWARIEQRILDTYMTEDQRFAAMRPDVLVFQSRTAGPRCFGIRADSGGSESVDVRDGFRFRREGDRRFPARLSGL